MAQNEEKEPKGFYEEHTTEITINGEKHRVNKYEAKDLEAKLKKNAKK